MPSGSIFSTVQTPFSPYMIFSPTENIYNYPYFIPYFQQYFTIFFPENNKKFEESMRIVFFSPELSIVFPRGI